MAELSAKATRHYQLTVLKNRGLGPWRRFVEAMRTLWQKAEEFHKFNLARGSLVRWRDATRVRVREREDRASSFYHTIIKRQTLQAWKEVSDHCLL